MSNISKNPMQQALNVTVRALNQREKAFKLTTENLANADNVAKPGQQPYQRKFLNLVEKRDTKTGEMTHTSSVGKDVNSFQREYEPSHPYADEQGFILKTKINTTQEIVNAMSLKEHTERLMRVHRIGRELLKHEINMIKD